MTALVWRELLVSARIGGGFWQGIAFYLVFVLISALGLGREAAISGEAAIGTIWVGTLLATIISLDRMFQADFEDGSLEALALSAQPLSAISVAKMLAHWLGSGLPLVIISPVLGGMLGLSIAQMGWVCLCLCLGTLAASAIGAIGAAVTMGVRRGGALLGLLVMPLFVPILIFGVMACQRYGEGEAYGVPTALLAAIALFSLVLSPVVCAAVIRLSLR